MPFYNGSFLVAKPTLLDPNFRQAVVLIIQHSEDGAFGLVVNRPVPVKDIPYPVFAGGPCEAEGLFLLHGNDEWATAEDDEPAKQIAPGIFLGDSACAELMKQLSKAELNRVRMVAGYAGWGPGQLEQELVEGAWAISSADGQMLFDIPVNNLWNHLRPPALPQPSLN